jgi:uncharacterized protein (TIRG00374 family)
MKEAIIKKGVLFIKFSLMLFLIWYLISRGKFDFTVLKDFVSGFNIIIVMTILILLVATHMLFCKRYQLLLSSLGFISTLRNTFYIIMVGAFYNNFLPGGAGGDILRIYYIKKTAEVPIPVGTAATILDRVLAFLALILCY